MKEGVKNGRQLMVKIVLNVVKIRLKNNNINTIQVVHIIFCFYSDSHYVKR